MCTKVRFVSFSSDGFSTEPTVNPSDKKLVNPTSVQCSNASALYCIALSLDAEVDIFCSFDFYKKNMNLNLKK